MTSFLPPFDLAALVVFVVTWGTYDAIVRRAGETRTGLMATMHDERFAWMQQMAKRENRIVDTSILNMLQNGTVFFATTSLFAIGGSAALLRATDDAFRVFADLPFGPDISRGLWELKAIGLTAIYGYAFFKFSWAVRLFNYSAVLIGATPLPNAPDATARTAAADRAARMAIAAGRSFATGQRALFFSFAYLGWFVGPAVLLATTALITTVVWRRQFRSEALAALGPVKGSDGAGALP